MSTGPGKVFVKIESNAEQQENLKNSRKTLKVLQRDAINKENLVGRPNLKNKGGFTKSKSEFDIKTEIPEFLKRKKPDTKTIETQTEANILLSDNAKAITADDLTTSKPGEKYWEVLAEKRRIALDTTLIENRNLHDRIEGLESELNTSNQLLDEAKGLIELLTEMIDEKENNAADTTTEDINIDDEDEDVNQGASTSGEASKYFDADSSESPNKINLNNDSDDD